MAFKPPIQTPLTDIQAEAISKISAVKNFAISLKKGKLKTDIPKENQISSYDFLIFFGKSIIGPAVIDILLKKFFDKLFSDNNDKLERMVIKSLAKALDKNNQKISTTESNESWLITNILPTFKIAKKTLVATIIRMMFGPRNKMPNGNNPYFNQQSCYESSVCGGSGGFFSVSNIPNTPPGDIEANKVKLQKQLIEGYVEFVVSCRHVKIRLPDNAEQIFGFDTVSNPADIIYNVENYVNSETQRIDAPENKNAVSRTFLENTVQSSMSYIGTALVQQLYPLFLSIQNQNPSINAQYLTQEIVGTPCSIIDVCSGDPKIHEKKSAFQSNLMNSIYAMLISLLFSEITRRTKQYIQQVLAEKIKRKAEKRLRRLASRIPGADAADALKQVQQTANKAQQAKQALGSISEITNFIKENT